MVQVFRLAKEHRSIYLIPVSVFAVFVLLQCMLQRNWTQTSHSSHGEGGVWNGDTQRMRNERRSMWEEMNEKWQLGATSMEDLGDAMTYLDVLGNRNVDGDGRTDEDDEEWERLGRSPYVYHEEEEINRLKSPVIQKEIKYISYYQPYDNTEKSFKVCRYSMCSYAKNLSQAEVIAFKAALIRDHGVPKFRRPTHQRWVLFTSDPAIKNYKLENPEIKSQFNATCTYRLDSDINWTFGKLRKIKPPSLDYDQIFDSKEGLAAWFVSHCHTFGRREEYVRRMQTVHKIDVFGMCNNRSCGNYNHRKDDNTSCLPMLSKKFKFYLSFENTFCEDYVTEKFFKLFKNIHIIPVVRGGVDYSQLFPSGVYINAADFDSPEKLAKYLVDLGNDKERYLHMLRKKSSWEFAPGGEMKHCMLCEYAHTQTTPKYYPDIKRVFNGDYPHCWVPTDIA